MAHLSRASPDAAGIGVNIGSVPAFLQRRREMRLVGEAIVGMMKGRSASVTMTRKVSR